MRVELTVSIFVWFLYSFYCLYDIEGMEQIDVQCGSVSDETHNGCTFPFCETDIKVHALEPLCQIF